MDRFRFEKSTQRNEMLTRNVCGTTSFRVSRSDLDDLKRLEVDIQCEIPEYEMTTADLLRFVMLTRLVGLRGIDESDSFAKYLLKNKGISDYRLNLETQLFKLIRIDLWKPMGAVVDSDKPYYSLRRTLIKLLVKALATLSTALLPDDVLEDLNIEERRAGYLIDIPEEMIAEIRMRTFKRRGGLIDG